MSAPETLTSLDGFASLVPATPVSHSRTPGRSAPTNESLVSEGWGWQVDFGSFIGPGAGYSLFGGSDAGDESLIGRYGGFWPSDRVQLPNHSTPGIFTEPQWRAGLMWSRWLHDYNPLALGFEKHVDNFIGNMDVAWVRRGQNPTATGAGEEDGGDPLLKEVEQVWEEICEANDWGEGDQDREKETRVRLFRDGEWSIRLGAGGPNRDRLPWMRFIEPEQIRTPTGVIPGDWSQDTNDWRWGVHCDPDDEETELAYWVCDPDSGGAKGEVVPASQVVRSKANCDRTIRRGKSDFFCIESHLQQVIGILGNMESTAREQSGVAWIQEWANATPDQLRSLLSQRQEAFGPGQGRDDSPTTGGAMPGGRNGWPMRNHGGTKVLHVGPQTQFKPGPTSEGVPSYTAAVDASIKAVRFRLCLPDSFVFGTGDSFAGVLIEGSPFVSEIENRQGHKAGATKRLAIRAMQLAEMSGRLRPGTMRQVKCVVTPKPVVMADESKKSTVVAQKLRDKITSPQMVIREDGGDPKQVVADWHAWEKEFPAPGTMPGPGGPPGAAPPGGAPPPEPGGPPGSAGGDGTDPEQGTFDLFNPVAESAPVFVQERATVGGTHPPPGTGWLYDHQKNHWYKAKKGKPTGETHPGIPNTTEPVPPERLSTKEEALAAVSKALEKFKRVPKPTPEELAQNKAGLAKLGANKFRRNLVGNSTDRAKRRAALLTEFGDGKTCPCIYCGIKIGEGTLEQDKIVTTAQGGRYRMANLVPACTNCNKHRSDTPFREIAKSLPKNAPAA